MLRIAVFFLSCLMTVACQAQLAQSVGERPPVADPTMVIDDRGAKLEILPTLRATPSSPGTASTQAHTVFASKSTAKFGPSSRGVVFNHARQARGYLTGEIAFKLKGQAPASEAFFPATDYPGLAKVTNPNVFLVVPQTPAEFIAVFKRLQARNDVEWVEPIVIYGPSSSGAAQ